MCCDTISSPHGSFHWTSEYQICILQLSQKMHISKFLYLKQTVQNIKLSIYNTCVRYSVISCLAFRTLWLLDPIKVLYILLLVVVFLNLINNCTINSRFSGDIHRNEPATQRSNLDHDGASLMIHQCFKCSLTFPSRQLLYSWSRWIWWQGALLWCLYFAW